MNLNFPFKFLSKRAIFTNILNSFKQFFFFKFELYILYFLNIYSLKNLYEQREGSEKNCDTNPVGGGGKKCK